MTKSPFHPFPLRSAASANGAILSSSIGSDPESYIAVTDGSGLGFSTAGDLALTCWEGAAATGLRFFIRDLDRSLWWPAGRATSRDFQTPDTRWEPGNFVSEQIGCELRVQQEICVVPGRSAQLHRITIRNLDTCTRRLDVTSLAEVVLNERAAHAAHPAFSKLFLQSSLLPDQRTLCVGRRSRSPHELTPVLVHSLLESGPVEFETDRARFFGRGRAPGDLLAMTGSKPLSGTVGNVLDPVVSLRRAFELKPGGLISCTFLLGAATDPDEIPELISALTGPEEVDRAFRSASACAEQRMAGIGISVDEQQAAEELAGAVLRREQSLRRQMPELEVGTFDPQRLAEWAIDRRYPLVVVEAEPEAVSLLEKLHRSWQSLGLPIQLTIIDDDCPNSGAAPAQNVVRLSGLASGDRNLLRLAADLYLDGKHPLESIQWPAPNLVAPIEMRDETKTTEPKLSDEIEFHNGWGGFTGNGCEYAIEVPSAGCGVHLPPRPWTNVMANDRFGCLVSETGAGTTWFGNSRENRLTPWPNDPLLDPHGEALFLRDETTGGQFSCQPGPAPGGGDYQVRHGQGYTRWQREGNGLEVQTLTCVDRTRPVRLTRIRVTNPGQQRRDLSLISVHQLVLGESVANDARYVVTEFDGNTNALLARSCRTSPFQGAVAAATLVAEQKLNSFTYTGDATCFTGGAGTPIDCTPNAGPLDGRTGAGLDPCLALQTEFQLEPQQTQEFWVLLAAEENRDRVCELIQEFTRPGACDEAWRSTRDTWRDQLDRIQIQTPVRELDLMVNGWLGYQTLACRLHGRSALYQSGGAYGYRDQLQDSLSLLPLWPKLVRDQILLHAGHQFVEGDVLHWWHPPLDRGIRTRFADDLLWLPWATAEYVSATGDREILEEVRPYLTAAQLEEGQDEVFLQAQPSGESGTLYDHCCRALDRSLVRGAHGLPLFGTGDWNDGMNRVGREGRGESVWMGFFLVKIIDGFLPFCLDRGQSERADRYRTYRDEMIHTLNDTGWDGDWYRRGYYDNGAPLGSWENKECAIDALAQSWSVLSGAASPRRAAQVMDAVQKHLIDEKNGLVRLLTPPFIDTPHDPGYIKGYVAGVRENGGQYTHAALWAVRAMAELGRRNVAARLLTMINPVRHTRDAEAVERYQVEPYVVAADVYGAEPHIGRGGWTWYTGSSGWMLRVALESILGLRQEGDELVVAPCVPDDWPSYSITWRVPGLLSTPDREVGTRPETRYDIEVINPQLCSARVISIEWDSQVLPPPHGPARLPLVRDGRIHQARITLGPEESP